MDWKNVHVWRCANGNNTRHLGFRMWMISVFRMMYVVVLQRRQFSSPSGDWANGPVGGSYIVFWAGSPFRGGVINIFLLTGFSRFPGPRPSSHGMVMILGPVPTANGKTCFPPGRNPQSPTCSSTWKRGVLRRFFIFDTQGIHTRNTYICRQWPLHSIRVAPSSLAPLVWTRMDGIRRAMDVSQTQAIYH